MYMNKIRLIKKLHLYLSIIIFFSLFFSSLFRTHLHLSEISLSRFGISQHGWIWNVGLFFVAILLYFKIKHLVSDFIQSQTLDILNKILSFNLMLTAIINMDYGVHNITALIYFISTSILIFLFGVKIHKTDFRIGQLSLFIAILSAIFPIITFPVIKSLAIPELEHVILLFTWLLILEHRNEVINIIKKIGL